MLTVIENIKKKSWPVVEQRSFGYIKKVKEKHSKEKFLGRKIRKVYVGENQGDVGRARI